MSRIEYCEPSSVAEELRSYAFDANTNRHMNGRKGQKALLELEAALLAMQDKRLASSTFAVTPESNSAPAAPPESQHWQQVVPGCAVACAGQARCVVGWPDGSCGHTEKGTMWPAPAKAPAPMAPGMRLLVKLGSIAVHAEEAMSDKAHQFDMIAMNQLLNDPEVKEWLAQMNKLAMLPVKR